MTPSPHNTPMTLPTPPAPDPSLDAIADDLATQFAATAVARDRAGGTALAERQLLRQSGLLKMAIPRELGGHGAPWSQTLRTVRRFAQVDSSIAQVFGFQHLMMATLRLFGSAGQWQGWMAQTARHDWFWGNALNPLDRRTQAHRLDGGVWSFEGHKSFCSGASDADMLIASAFEAGGDRLLIAALPASRAGITVLDDWDNMGQRQTDSGSVRFERVAVEPQELLSDPGPFSSPFACLRSLVAQLVITNVYLGLAEGAVDQAREYTLNHSRPWPGSAAATAGDDPYVLLHYGEFGAALEGSRLLADRAGSLLDAAWARGLDLTEAERGDLAVAIAAAKVTATRTGLDLTSRMFDVAGARATSGALRLDRFWRNLRTYSLHDPVDHKLRELGQWVLHRRHPAPSFYG